MANRWGKSRNSNRFYFLGLLNHCRWWLQPWNSKTLDPWNKSYDKPRQHISKQKYHFAKKCPDSQSMVFSVVMYTCETWTIKKAEHPKIDAFELWCWRRLLRVPWTARRPNQLILKEINSEDSLDGLMPKHQYFGHLTWRADSLEKTLMLGKMRESEKGAGEDKMVGWHHQLNGHEFEQTLGDGKGQGSLVCCRSWGHKESDMTEQLNDKK